MAHQDRCGTNPDFIINFAKSPYGLYENDAKNFTQYVHDRFSEDDKIHLQVEVNWSKNNEHTTYTYTGYGNVIEKTINEEFVKMYVRKYYEDWNLNARYVTK